MATVLGPYDVPILDESFEASADLSANQYFLHNLDVSGQLELAGDGEYAYALQGQPEAADRVSAIRVLGITRVVAGAAIAVGALVQSNAAGKGITAAAGTVVGRALTAAAGDGNQFSMLVIPN